jgi:hypothetical protein
MPKSAFRAPSEFVSARGDGCEAVIVRIGLNDAQVVVVDADGDWERWVYHSHDEAASVAGGLGTPVHDGEFPEELRVRMNAHRRSRDSFDAGAYPEQGEVGPVIPYPENRPRRVAATEAADGHGRREEESPPGSTE